MTSGLAVPLPPHYYGSSEKHDLQEQPPGISSVLRFTDSNRTAERFLLPFGTRAEGAARTERPGRGCMRDPCTISRGPVAQRTPDPVPAA